MRVQSSSSLVTVGSKNWGAVDSAIFLVLPIVETIETAGSV